MKFADGYWLTQRGYNLRYASQAYAVETDSRSIRVLATPTHIHNRGQTLGGPNLEVTFTAAAKDIIKVRIVHYQGIPDRDPKFDLHEDPDCTPIIREIEHAVELITGNTRVRIGLEDWNVQYFYDDKRLTRSIGRALSYIEEDKSHAARRLNTQIDDGFWSYPKNTQTAYLREQLDLSVGEYIYGFGEKFTAFTKNGQSVSIWNADGGTCCEQSYKSIPFYLSSRGYGVFVNSADNVSYEVGSDTVSKVSFTTPGESLEYYIIGGENLREVLSNYTALTGKPALPPAWSFGLWLTTSFTTTYDEETITSFIDGMAQRDIPLQVFHFDCFWMKEFEWCNFEWDKRQFPEPDQMLQRLHRDKGLKTCVWINPYIAQRSKLFTEGMQHGYFLHNPDGTVFQCDMWQPAMAIVDFTNPDACAWYASKLRALCEMGVDCFKTDFGERIPTEVVYFNGADPIKMHNYYSYLYNKTVYDVLHDFYGEHNACLFARSATVGGQQFPVHWGGDCSAEYASMAETIRGGLSLCASGFGFFSHDISGFEATATPDIYKRWCAFGLMSTHSRLHGNSSYRVPWLFDEESCDVLRFFTNLKGRLMPYLYSQAVNTHKTGVPMMRAMVIDYADDPACLTLDRQYLLGDSLLCAPVLNDEHLAEFYVPAGRWTDLITGRVYEGGAWYRTACNYFEMPILVRPASILVYGAFTRDFEYPYLEGAAAVIYELGDGELASASVYDHHATLLTEIRAERRGNRILVTYTKTEYSFTVKVAGTDITVQAMAGTDAVEIMLE